LRRVLDPKNDCLLATKYNGEPISPDHGYPVRALLPGIAGARNVKVREKKKKKDRRFSERKRL